MPFAECVAQLRRLHADVGKELELAPPASVAAIRLAPFLDHAPTAPVDGEHLSRWTTWVRLAASGQAASSPVVPAPAPCPRAS